jgi:hypothetical protein
MSDDSKITRKEVAQSIVEAAQVHPSRIECQDPAKAARVLEKIAEGLPWKQIMREEGVAWNTLVVLRSRHKSLLDKRKEIIAQDAMALIEGIRMLQHEKLRMLAEDENALKRVNIRDLAMSYGLYADKFFMATDGNKVVVEHKSGAPSIEDARKAIEEARAKARASAIDAVAIDVTPKEVSHEKEKDNQAQGQQDG